MDQGNPENNSGEDVFSKRRKTQSPFKEEKEEQVQGDKTERPWSNISEDILELIVHRLNISDRIRSSRVCKHWRYVVLCMAPKAPASSYGNPCLLRLSIDNQRCVLIDTFLKEHFILDTPSLPLCYSIGCSDYGWLLLAADVSEPSPVLFFNPLTRTTIELPKLESSCIYRFTFSSPPTSPDYVVISMFSFTVMEATHFNYYRPGDEDWTQVVVRHRESFIASGSKAILFNDRIYVLDILGRLGVYDIFSGRTLTIVIRNAPLRNNHESDMLNLVEMDDKLKLVLTSLHDGFIRVYEFDDSEKQWIKLKSIGKKLLFSCMTSSIYMNVTSQEGEMVYVLRLLFESEIMSYSFISNELQTFGKLEDKFPYCRSICWIELKP